LHAGYQRLLEKHKALNEKPEQEKDRVAEAHTVDLAKLRADLDLETHSYTEYRQTVHRWLHELHETVASSFDEVKAQCLPFPDKGAKVEEMIDLVALEVKAMPDTIWRLNDNFTILGIEGVLNILNGEGCQDLTMSRGASALENVPDDLHKLAGWIMRRWWKPYGLPEAVRRLEAAHATMVNDSDNRELMFCIVN
jgi:hypothetical protein